MNLKQYLKEYGIPVARFARKVGYSRGYIAMILLGVRNPSERAIRDICDGSKGQIDPSSFHELKQQNKG